MRVFFLGQSQTQHIAKVYRSMGHDTRFMVDGSKFAKFINVFEILRADIIYQVFGEDIRKSKYLTLSALLKKKIVLHWIGTDVLLATEDYRKSRKIINTDFLHIDLACAKHLQDELAQIGIQSEYVPIFPPDISFKPLPLPDKHAVLSYIPEKRAEFYGMRELHYLAKKFPHIDFHIVANSGQHDSELLPNVFYHGLLRLDELKELYKRCTILFRYSKHDGLPVMLIEALGLGRQVIFSFKFPYAHTPCSDKLEDLEELFGHLVSLPPEENRKGSEYVNSQFTPNALIERYKELNLI